MGKKGIFRIREVGGLDWRNKYSLPRKSYKSETQAYDYIVGKWGSGAIGSLGGLKIVQIEKKRRWKK